MNMIPFFVLVLLASAQTQELEIGLIQLEQDMPQQMQNQIVQFETPFSQPPQILLSLVNNTETKAIFAKIQSITQNDFIIQFFSIQPVTATYRYLATVDDRIQINCTNFRINDEIIINFNKTYLNIPIGATFITGFQQQGKGDVWLKSQSNQSSHYQANKNNMHIQLRAANINTLGVCSIIGPESVLQIQNVTNSQFVGLTSLEGDTEELYLNQLEQNEQIDQYFSSLEQLDQMKNPLKDLKNYFNKEILKEDNSQKILNTNDNIQLQQHLQEEFQANDQEDEQKEYYDYSKTNDNDEEDKWNEYLNDNDDYDNDTDDYDNDNDDYDNDNDDENEFEPPTNQLSIDFQFQLSKLKDALTSKNENVNNNKYKEYQVEIPNQIPKQEIKKEKQKKKFNIFEMIKKQEKNQIINENEQLVEANKVEEEEIVNNESNANHDRNQTVKEEEKNNDYELQLKQKESHLKTAQPVLLQIEQVNKIETTEMKVNNKQEDQPKTYQSPLFSDSPRENMEKKEEKIENQSKKPQNLRLSHKLLEYVDKLNQEEVNNDLIATEKQKNQIQVKASEQTKQEKEVIDTLQTIQYKQIEEDQVVQDAISKYEQEFEQKKKQKLEEIKYALKLQEVKAKLPEFKPILKAQETVVDEKLKAYKDFFFN